MPLLKYAITAFTAGAAIAAFLSGVLWIKAASVKVRASSDNVGVGWGGVPVNVKDHTGEVLDFLQTYALQSKWNSRAALMSGVAGLLGTIAF
jgi:hypothetical protein